jgi:hypothetical protein
MIRHRLRSYRIALGALAVFCLLASKAHAGASDTTVLSVTPGNITYGVLITSPIASGTTGYDFGQVALGATTISTLAIQIQSAGNASEYFALAISNSNPDGWTAINTGTPGYDQFLLKGHFVTHGAGQPASGTFNVNTDTVTVSIPSAAAGRYGQAAQTNPGVTDDLYLMLTMPATVASGRGQSMTLTINGQAN